MAGSGAGSAAGGPAVLQAGACPLEGAGDRLDRRVQHVGHLARTEAEDVAQDQHGDLAWRQDLQGGHECKRDRFLLVVAGLRAGRHAEGAFEEGVGIRLQPEDLAESGRRGWFDVGHVPLLGRPAAGRATRVEAGVGGDPVEPGSQRGVSLEPPEAPPGGQQGLLKGVLGILHRTEHPVAVHPELAPVRLGELFEGIAITGAGPRDLVGRHHRSVSFLPRPAHTHPG